MITWGEKYSVGIKQIDEQHKGLINSVNLLLDAMKQGKGKEVLEEILDFLAKYTVEHFKTEESLMQKNGYSSYLTHKVEHDKLVLKVTELITNLKSGKIVVTMEVMNFLSDWLNNHILKVDMAYKEYFKSKGLS